ALVVLASVTTSLAGMIPALLAAVALRGAAFLLVVTAIKLLSRHTVPHYHMMWTFTALRMVDRGFPSVEDIRPGLGASLTLVCWTLAVACALAIARVQYGIRRRGATWASVAAAFVLITVVRGLWRWDFVGGKTPAIWAHA